MRKLNKLSEESKSAIRKRLGIRLINARSESDFTQNEVAKSLSILQSSLSRYETGEQLIDLYTLAELAVLYDKSFIDLIPLHLQNISFKTLQTPKKLKIKTK